MPVETTGQPRSTSTDLGSEALLAELRAIVYELHPHMRGRVSITLDSSLDRDLGLDSIARMELLSRLELALGSQLPEYALANAETPRDVLGALLPAGKKARIAHSVERREVALQGVEAVPAGAATLLEALEWHASRHAGRTHILVYGEEAEPRNLTYAALIEGAQAVAAGLLARGLRSGEAVAIMLPTGVEYFHAFLAIQLVGGTPVPIYPPARSTQIEDHFRRHARILENARVRLLITFASVRSVARLLTSLVAGLAAVVSVDELRGAGHPEVCPAAGADDIAFLQYTSGSTGDPKGVVLTHADVLANLRAMGQALDVTPRDVFVSWLPLYHDMGLIGAWMGALYFGFPLVLMSPLAFLARPIRWLEAIHRHAGTLSGGPNFAYELCLQRIRDEEIEGLDLSSWRVAFNGAEPVSADTLGRFAARFAPHGLAPRALTPVYGLAEATLGVAFTPVGRGVHLDRIDREAMSRTGRALPAAKDAPAPLTCTSSGLPIPGFEVRSVDASGHEAGERGEGAIQFRGPSTTRGYFRNPEATAALFDGEWLNSGDRGYIAAGELYITGRNKDLIIRAGRNIYPYELEEAVGDVDGIRRGCVAAFGVVDPHAGTESLVVVAETRERAPERWLELRARIEACAVERLGGSPDDVILAPPHTVLKTSSGKIRRAAMRELYARGALRQTPRAVWLQLVRLAVGALHPLVRRCGQAALRALYTLQVCAVAAVLVPGTWIAVVTIVPGVERRWALARRASRALLWALRIPLSVAGAERLPREGPVVVVVNHASYLDGVVLLAALPRRVCYVAKGELREHLVSRAFLERMGIEFIDRLDRQRSVEDSRRLGARLQDGAALGFFPEGTLHRMPGLLPFQLGAFTAAAETAASVVPVTLRGTRSILRDGEFMPRRGAVQVHVGAPLPAGATHGSAWERAVRLRDAARAVILRHCGEPDLAARHDVLAVLKDQKREQQD